MSSNQILKTNILDENFDGRSKGMRLRRKLAKMLIDWIIFKEILKPTFIREETANGKNEFEIRKAILMKVDKLKAISAGIQIKFCFEERILPERDLEDFEVDYDKY